MESRKETKTRVTTKVVNSQKQAVVDERENEGNGNQMLLMLKDLKVSEETPLRLTQRQFFSSFRLESPQERKKKKGSKQLQELALCINCTQAWFSAIREVLGKGVKCKRHRARVGAKDDRITNQQVHYLQTSQRSQVFIQPLEVKRCRSFFNPHGVMFTCKAIWHATHIEIAFSLEPDSFINVLGRELIWSEQNDSLRVTSQLGICLILDRKCYRKPFIGTLILELDHTQDLMQLVKGTTVK